MENGRVCGSEEGEIEAPAAKIPRKDLSPSQAKGHALLQACWTFARDPP